MKGKIKRLYEFDSYSLNPDERIFTKNGAPIQLAPRAFEVLVVLVQNFGSLVEKQNLIHMVWNDSFVEDANIQVQISAIRKALNDKDNRKYIETVPKRGYRFTAEVKIVEVGDLSEMPMLSHENPDSAVEEKPDERPKYIKPVRQKSNRTAIFLIAAIVILGAGLLIFAFVKQKPTRTDFASFSQGMKLTKLTDSGSAFGAAISADGKYAVYQAANAGKYSLCLMELGTNKSLQITPPGETALSGITFSPGDDYIYYSTADNQPNSVSSIYRMSRLGGDAKKLLTADSPITFSADGRRFAFVRSNREKGETALMIAAADGTNEQTIAVRQTPDTFSTGKRPAFAPDGKTIACIGINSSENFLRVFTVNIAGGEILKSFDVPQNTQPDSVQWKPDSRSIIYRCNRNNIFNIWLQSIDEAEPTQLTDFKFDPPVNCKWSGDGKTLSCVRTSLVRDVILFGKPG